MSLQELRELTSQLSFPPTIEQHYGVAIHEMSCGTSIAFSLLQQEEVSVAKWFNSSGTHFPEHTHEQREWIIVFIGSMFTKVGDEPEKRILPGQSLIIEPNTVHSARFLEDCWYLAITVPKTEDWPSKKGQDE